MWRILSPHCFFIPWTSNVDLIKPVLGVGWTLNYEMYFYLGFSFLVIAPTRLFLPLVSLTLFAGVALGELFKVDTVLLSVIESPLVIEFLVGCVIGVVYTKGFKTTRLAATALLGAGIAGFLLSSAPWFAGLGIDGAYPVGDYQRFVKWGIPSGFLIIGIVYLERLKAMRINRLMVELGNSSYSLYLTHVFVINAVGIVWVKIFHGYYNAYLAVSFVVGIVIGYIAYLAIEKPFTAYLNDSYRAHKRSKALMPC